MLGKIHDSKVGKRRQRRGTGPFDKGQHEVLRNIYGWTVHISHNWKKNCVNICIMVLIVQKKYTKITIKKEQDGTGNIEIRTPQRW